MKKFERYIIYPILFIVLFFSFSGDDLHQTTAQQVYDEIIARKITIVNEDGQKMSEISSDIVNINHKNKTKEYGNMKFYSEKGDLMVEIGVIPKNILFKRPIDAVGGVWFFDDDSEEIEYDYIGYNNK
jgi:hypothetical protein